jgi:hypothetical protein
MDTASTLPNGYLDQILSDVCTHYPVILAFQDSIQPILYRYMKVAGVLFNTADFSAMWSFHKGKDV